ncbi:Sialomucin core protein 24 [Papilio machaon]|uniref:Sialomucin core protein 24 n=1 Tax=Papilio machaon TaxID=76193 RepID=A0A194RAS0_PAPMA|nr:Sialomucin core protein 24 [Papilio machaon]
MKKVIFLCLLSLSFCLSKPTDEGKPSQPQTTNATPDPKVPVATEKSPAITGVTEQKPAQTTTSEKNSTTEVTPVPNEKTNTSQTAPSENKTKKDTEPQKETEKKVEPAKEMAPAKPEPETKASTEIQKDVTPAKPEEKTEKATITSTEKSAVTTKPTEAPKKDEDKPTLQSRGFDGPSFIGGIILTLGLLAIGFIGFKYYKNHTERNYHTL